MHNKDSQKKIDAVVTEINQEFFDEHIESFVDDSDKRSGEKFFHWEMKGVPFRIEIGARELEKGGVSVFVRDTKEKVLIKLENIVEEIKNLGAEYDVRLRERADASFDGNIVRCKTKAEIKKTLDSGKIAQFNFCSVEKSGQKCAEFIEKDLSARVMGTRADMDEKATGKCLFCGSAAKEVVYAGKSY